MKDKILQTALEYFLKYGIREMSIPKLIAVLGISSKTVYKYFNNKEELIEEVIKLYYEQQYLLLENLKADHRVIPLLIDIWYKSIEIEYNVNNLFYQDLHYYYPELETKTLTTVGQKFWAKFQQLVQRGIDEGVFKNDITPEVVLEGVYILYDAVARTDHFEKFHISPYKIFLNTIMLYIRGFCTPKGILELDKHVKTLKSFGEIAMQ